MVAKSFEVVHKIEFYLDVIDLNIEEGERLGDYIREQLGGCTHLLAVISENTKSSWWVPWEIGIATEKEQPIATFAMGNEALPEYLRKWPYLRTMGELDAYAEVCKQTMKKRRQRAFVTESGAQRSSTSEFYSNLRARLRQ